LDLEIGGFKFKSSMANRGNPCLHWLVLLFDHGKEVAAHGKKCSESLGLVDSGEIILNLLGISISGMGKLWVLDMENDLGVGKLLLLFEGFDSFWIGAREWHGLITGDKVPELLLIKKGLHFDMPVSIVWVIEFVNSFWGHD
jgi:hypothetical protein